MKRLALVLNFIFNLASAQPIIIAHRGASGYEPENTLRAFKRAIAMKADAIELDIYASASGDLVVIHDATVDRTTHGKGLVKQLTLDELKKLNAGKDEKIPLLSEVFDLVDKKIIINIEIKDPQAVKPLTELIKMYVKNKGWSYDTFIVSSFDASAIRNFHEIMPQVKTGHIFENENTNTLITSTKKAHAKYLIVDYQHATKQLIDQAHKGGLKIFAYTVNDKVIAKKLSDLKIDGIITNFPDILR